MALIRLFMATILTIASPLALAAGPYPGDYVAHGLNGSQPPSTMAGVTTFHIEDRECSDIDYGDGRGESDCLNGNVRSQISQTRRVGDTLEYRFDIRIDPALAYTCGRDELAYGLMPDAWDTQLLVAHWEGNLLHNYVHRLKLDSTKGLTFLGEVCQAPEQFGEWVSFSMKVRWANDPRGWIKVTCDDNVIYAAEGAATTVNPHCYIRNQCEPGIKKEPSRVYNSLGLLSHGHGMFWADMRKESQFNQIQPGGITVEMRNIETNRDPELYSAEEREFVRQLQTRLSELGCDVGAADGVAGPRTRAAALSCRAFPEGELPASYNVMTLPKFVELYAAPRAANLPVGREPGSDLVKTQYTVMAGEDFSETQGPSSRVHSEIVATVEGKSDMLVRFAIAGRYNFKGDSFGELSIVPYDQIDDSLSAVEQCATAARVEMYYGNYPVVSLKFKRDGSSYVIEGADCVIESAPRPLAQRIAFLVDHFSDVAVGIARDGTVLRNDGLRAFMNRVARGEITVGRR